VRSQPNIKYSPLQHNTNFWQVCNNNRAGPCYCLFFPSYVRSSLYHYNNNAFKIDDFISNSDQRSKLKIVFFWNIFESVRFVFEGVYPYISIRIKFSYRFSRYVLPNSEFITSFIIYRCLFTYICNIFYDRVNKH